MEVATLRFSEPKPGPLQLPLEERVVKVSGRAWNLSFTLDDEVALPRVEDGLRRYLKESRGWFTGGKVTVDVGRRIVQADEIRALRGVFEDEFGLKVAGFTCDVHVLEQAIQGLAGVPVSLTADGSVPRIQERLPDPEPGPLLFKGTCRSGSIISHEGDVVVRGDVNPGAQVSATGDIIVLGTLRGIVHAGATEVGNSEAVIIALSLQPLQLRIGHQVSIAPPAKGSPKAPAHPEIAYVNGRSIVVAPFTGGLPNIPEPESRGTGRSRSSGASNKPSSRGERGKKRYDD